MWGGGWSGGEFLHLIACLSLGEVHRAIDAGLDGIDAAAVLGVSHLGWGPCSPDVIRGSSGVEKIDDGASSWIAPNGSPLGGRPAACIRATVRWCPKLL